MTKRDAFIALLSKHPHAATFAADVLIGKTALVIPDAEIRNAAVEMIAEFNGWPIFSATFRSALQNTDGQYPTFTREFAAPSFFSARREAQVWAESTGDCEFIEVEVTYG